MTSGRVVGIVAHEHMAIKGFGELPVTGSASAYVEAVATCGGRAVLLPGATAADLIDLVDAVVLTGGGDVDPVLAGSEPRHCVDVDSARDEAELAVIAAARARRLPLLGVCRGMQLLAVGCGGTLAGGLDHVRPAGGHPVRTAAGSLVRQLVGGRVTTTALHRQAVAEPGGPWKPTAWAADGTVEALEWRAGDWPVLGVQWHPEMAWHGPLDDGTGRAIFGWLVGSSG